tara:strand:+ start:174383 stop:174964 length:582 start_codon:yes stop_codon:yes gene_type:complete
MKEIILASGSEFRREILSKLAISFHQQAADVDETALVDESPSQLVQRLSIKKAKALVMDFPDALIIGSDEVAVLDDKILGKPHTHENATAQLRAASGKTMAFYTGLCLLDAESGRTQVEVETGHVQFRELSDEVIEAYLQHEKPYSSAGSVKAEGLAIALFSDMKVNDPNAIIGLPLIKLVSMLHNEGVACPK